MNRILVLLISLFLVLPVSSVFASDVSTPKPDNFLTGLLDDKFIVEKTNITYNMRDNDLSTSINLDNNTIYSVDFVKPVDINGYYLDRVKGLGAATITFTFRGNETRVFTTKDGSAMGYFPVSLSDVSRIEFKKSFKNSYEVRVNEIDFFGTYTISSYDPVTNLQGISTYNTVHLSWDNPENDNLENIIIKQNGIEVAELSTVKSYSITGLNPETTYNFEVISKYDDGTLSSPETITIDTLAVPDDILPPDEISSLTASVTSFDATFAWINPPDSDFKHVRIYRDGELIEDSHTLNTYSATGLVPNKTYVFKFVTVDVNGNNSSGYIQTIKTKPELDNIAPDAVKGIYVFNGNKSGSLRWDASKAHDLSFYNVYVDGVKHNTSPILSTNYILSNLDNDKTYEINVTAVDTSENESVFSSSVFLNPEEGAMPVFKASYDLKAVSDGTGNWFGTMWPILAFAVGLPLAFIVANRMKTLFFA